MRCFTIYIHQEVIEDGLIVVRSVGYGFEKMNGVEGD